MIDSSSTWPGNSVDGRDDQYRQPYLATYRALAACTRELARLGEAVADDVAALHSDVIDAKPVVRQSPGRCIVQLGPVALTLAWLRGMPDTAATGELLVIVWRGSVAPPMRNLPERSSAGGAAAATSLWEETFTAAGENEESWAWRPQGGGADTAVSSAALAARCVERLRAAYVSAGATPAPSPSARAR